MERPPKASSQLLKQALVGNRTSPIMPILEESRLQDALTLTEEDASNDHGSNARGGSASTSGAHTDEQHLPSWEHYWDSATFVDIPDRGRFHVYTAGSSGPVIMCLHGGGYTGLTWSLVAAKLKHKYRIVAPDLRGHGLTQTSDDADLSGQTMAADVVGVWQALFGGSAKRVPTILVGHSMGGALAVWAAASKGIAGLDGVVVIDVVEGTALAALPHMVNVLNGRPSSFASPQHAIDWATRSHMSRNREAAAISMPSQLRQADSGQWLWRTPLFDSRQHWQGWYAGLSEAFLALPCPKVLALAGTDRLDKVLTIGQMQGKFQLILMPTAGHAIHEDEPDRMAEHLQQFLQRFRVGEPPMQFPRAPAGVKPVLPIVAGPAATATHTAMLLPQPQQQLHPS